MTTVPAQSTPDDPLAAITASLQQLPPEVYATIVELSRNKSLKDHLLSLVPEELLTRAENDPAAREAALNAYTIGQRELANRHPTESNSSQTPPFDLTDPARRGELLHYAIVELVDQFEKDPDPSTTADMRERARLLRAADSTDLEQWHELLTRADLYVELLTSPTKLAAASLEDLQYTLGFGLLAAQVNSMQANDPAWDQPVLPGLDETPLSAVRPLRSVPSPDTWPESVKQFVFALKVLLLTWIRRGELPDRTWEAPVAWAPPANRRLVPVAIDSIPSDIRQSTFAEVKAIAMAISDGALDTANFRGIVGTENLAHSREDESSIKTRLVFTAVLAWLCVASNRDGLINELKRAGQPAIMLLHVLLQSVIEGRPDQHQGAFVTLSIDELIDKIGYQPRSSAERCEMQDQVWHWIGLITSFEAVGTRRGRYKDRRGAEIDMNIDGPLLMLGEQQRPADEPYDPESPPAVVVIGPSPWLERLRDKRWVLPDFGQIPALAAIPDGKPSGTWARSIGLALHQIWRERSSDEDGMERPFTRRQLLQVFPPAPTVWDILEGQNPRRAIAYWDQAIAKLKIQRVIGSYRELAPLPTGARGQERWRDWLTQPLDIKPAAAGRLAAGQIKGKAEAARKARASRRRQAETTAT